MDNLGKKQRRKPADIKTIKSTPIKAMEPSKTIGPYEATLSGSVYYKNNFEPVLKSKKAPVFIRGSRHQQRLPPRPKQVDRQVDVSYGVLIFRSLFYLSIQ